MTLSCDVHHVTIGGVAFQFTMDGLHADISLVDPVVLTGWVSGGYRFHLW